jgi:protocatechuate 3,4-dioxygenase beta subunit
MDRNWNGISRRALLKALSLAPVVLAGPAPVWAASRVGLVSTKVCMLAPQATEGPFYLDPELVRADITEGRPGAPLELVLQVVTADCRAVEGARVDVWHCDAQGNYSGFARQGSDAVSDTTAQTFLRGTQFCDAGGIARFQTIYPGWYRGRATHIHYKVFLDEAVVLTSQLYFPDAFSERLYGTVAPYTDRASDRRVANADDGIFARSGDGAVAEVAEQSGGHTASLVVGVAEG